MTILTVTESHAMERPGYKRVVLGGRAYPTPEQAIKKLRDALSMDDIDVPDGDIWAVEEMPGTFCPYGADALIPE